MEVSEMEVSEVEVGKVEVRERISDLRLPTSDL